MLRNILYQTKQSARSFSTARALKKDVAKFTAIGRIGGDMTPLTGPSGRQYIKYPLAVNTNKDYTSWFNVVVFEENMIRFMSTYLKKGTMVYIEADASVSRYETEEGSRQSLQLIQQRVEIINSSPPKDIIKTGQVEESETTSR